MGMYNPYEELDPHEYCGDVDHSSITCNRCGEEDLHWEHDGDRYLLYDEDGDRHVCEPSTEGFTQL